jgi:hypothetical protein
MSPYFVLSDGPLPDGEDARLDGMGGWVVLTR